MPNCPDSALRLLLNRLLTTPTAALRFSLGVNVSQFCFSQRTECMNAENVMHHRSSSYSAKYVQITPFTVSYSYNLS